jgi:cytoskeletal protein CcmA (bactofilin family)
MFGRKQNSASLTYLNATTEIQGNLHLEGDLRVDGVVYGTVHVKGDMELSQTGVIEGRELKAHNLIVHGWVKADRVVVTGRLTLSRTARLEGNVTAQSLDIEGGAVYAGHIDTTVEEERSPSFPPGALTLSEYSSSSEHSPLSLTIPGATSE